MASYDLPTVAVAGKAPYLALLPGLRAMWARRSLHIDFVEFEVDNPSLDFMVDTLEFLPKAGVVAIDIWHPRIQAVAGVTDAMESASEAGSIDFIAFRDSDFGFPYSHNVAFGAAMRSLDQADVVGALVLIVGDQVPAQGVRAALSKLGAAEVTVLEWGPSSADAADQEHARALAAVDVILDLSPAAPVSQANEASGKMLPGFAGTWNADRIQEILEISTAEEMSAEVSRDLATVFATQAGQSL